MSFSKCDFGELALAGLLVDEFRRTVVAALLVEGRELLADGDAEVLGHFCGRSGCSLVSGLRRGLSFSRGGLFDLLGVLLRGRVLWCFLGLLDGLSGCRSVLCFLGCLGEQVRGLDAHVLLELVQVCKFDGDLHAFISSLFVLYWDCVLLGSEALAPGLNLFVQP